MYKNSAWKENQILLWKCNGGGERNPPTLNYNHVSVVCFGSENTWEPIENIECHNLVNGYEKSLKRKPRGKTQKTVGRRLPPNSSTRRGGQSNDFTAFQGLVAEAIVGATDACGELLHLVKWEGKEELELVPAIFTTMKFPLIVMAFYENRVKIICSNLK
jgi:hypothetical protein